MSENNSSNIKINKENNEITENKEENIENNNIEMNQNILNIESVIKPVNNFEENKNEDNKEKKKEKPKEINRPIYNPNTEISQLSLMQNLYTLNNNQPSIVSKNENSRFNILSDNNDISKLINKTNNNGYVNKDNQYKEDYFYSIYQSYAAKNKIIKNLRNLDDKVNKASSKPLGKNEDNIILSKRNELNSYKIKTKENNIKEKKNISISGNKVNSYDYKNKNLDLNISNQAKDYFINLQNELKNFSFQNKNKKNNEIDKSSGFEEVNQKIEEFYKKIRGNQINNNELEKNKIINNKKEEANK